MTAKLVILIIASYTIGNISPSTILARSRGIDIKAAGSGNAGTTNALRVLGPKAALITLIVDIGKGFLPAAVAMKLLGLPWAGLCALAVFAGHVWPVFLRFRGGKGVAAAFGSIFAIDWRIALICLAAAAVIVLVSRMVSLGSVSAAVLFPVLCFFMNEKMLISGIIMAVILIFKHKSNIARIAEGKENRLNFKKKKF